MCPPAQPPSSPAEIGFYWSDEEIFLFLNEYTRGVRLPNNVLSDSSPYLYLPSNLPEGIWYLVHLNEKKESAFGFWKAKEEPRKIYSNSVINGWRSTLEYYEGQAPHTQRTNWLMQEYSITQKELLCEKTHPKESKSLCRVFLCNRSSFENRAYTKDCGNMVVSEYVAGRAPFVPKANNTSEQDFRSESKANSSPKEITNLECFLKGDYLELNDLGDLESHSSSSQNSSCPSKLSDEYFDSLALLNELEEEDVVDTHGKYLSSRYNTTTSVGSKDVIMVPPSSGSIVTVAASTSVNELTDEHVLEHCMKRDVSETKDEANLNSYGANTHEIVNAEKKEIGAGRKKIKLKQYICFAYF